MSLNSWGTVTLDNREQAIQNTQKYKNARLTLANKAKELLNSMNLPPVWFIEGGTLIGAYRNNKMIEHDDDFDMALLGDEKEFDRVYAYLEEKLELPYQVRKISSYCKKIEIYDSESGMYTFAENENYHNVSLDLTLMTDVGTHVQHQYFKNHLCNFKYNLEWIVPTKLIEYEGFMFNCPNDSEKVLTEVYGYIGPNAIFDTKTGKYKDRYTD
jgi:phosphorylcholine metabolism protein LicD